jgi:hypothetical protein
MAEGGRTVAQLWVRQTPLAFGDTAEAVLAQLTAVPAPAGPPAETSLVADVGSVGIKVEHVIPETGLPEPVEATVPDRCSVTLGITCVEPVRARTTRTKSVVMETNTGVKVGSVS